MYRVFFLLFFASQILSAQNLKSPEAFFGYGYGERFHFHAQVADYAKYLANSNPKTVKLIPYGRTSEGRDLMVLAFASEENINNLEEIRKANLQNIGLESGSGGNVPVIAMLSYNVHGNEAVNTEVALQMMYTLTNSDNKFKDIIVLIDPCVNPDGFDRYSQWYNRQIGRQPNANPEAVEHNEPWPGGRFNHYYFDMNRDLAWQTQFETQQRIRFYNSWMPHFHGDFHEMGPNSTYFFAPSAKPYHEDFTAFQRDFQHKIGNYHKKEFDEKGWEYYTKANYDLLYPGYGDTYPSYNGAIAMTYEQGGSGRAGLAFLKSNGDTLTLAERMDHSYSTSIAALTAVSENASEIKEAFNKYFVDTKKAGYGSYKSFVMQGKTADKLALAKLLDKLEIKYAFSDKKLNLKGFNYNSQISEPFTLENNDLIVNTFQPKGIFTKIIFEPHTMLEDSSTYDITAWALPYVFGLNAYALTQKIEGDKSSLDTEKPSTISSKAYAYALKMVSKSDYKFLAQALNSGIKAKLQPEAFRANNKDFPAGTVVLLQSKNQNLENSLKAIQEQIPANLEAFNSGMVESGNDLGVDEVEQFSAPRIGIFMGNDISPTGFGEIWHFIDQELAYPNTLLSIESFERTKFNNYDILVFPSGDYDKNIAESKNLAAWIEKGGRLILMEDACKSFAGIEGYSLKEKTKEDEKPNLHKKYGLSMRDELSANVPGAIFEINLDNSHPLAYGYGEKTAILVKSPNNYELLKDGWNVGTLGAWKSGFVGSKLKKEMKDVPVFAVQDKGRGKVIYLVESPIFRGFWHAGKALFTNALFFVK